MNIPSIKELFGNHVHLGHKKEHSDPRFKKYIFSKRDGIYIIDLAKTQQKFKEAFGFLSKLSRENKTILFVGTKKQAKEITEEIAKKYSFPYISSRWLGGTLTNFETVLKNIKNLEYLERKISSDEFGELSKKEQSSVKKELDKVKKSFDGLRKLKKIPDCLFIIDAHYEKNAVMEANKLNIPIVAICDSNTNPQKIDWPIPANDEAKKSIETIVRFLSEAFSSKNK